MFIGLQVFLYLWHELDSTANGDGEVAVAGQLWRRMLPISEADKHMGRRTSICQIYKFSST